VINYDRGAFNLKKFHPRLHPPYRDYLTPKKKKKKEQGRSDQVRAGPHPSPPKIHIIGTSQSIKNFHNYLNPPRPKTHSFVWKSGQSYQQLKEVWDRRMRGIDDAHVEKLEKLEREGLVEAYSKMNEIREKIKEMLEDNRYNIYREILDRFIEEKIKELKD
jgi:hypothetical protein